MSDLFSLRNKIALVTGASRGLGRDMAVCLAEAGATVLCAGRALKDLETTVKVVKKKKGKAEAVILDVTDAPEARRGGTATLIGDRLDIDTVGRAAGTIGYEIVTRIGPRVPREYTGVGA